MSEKVEWQLSGPQKSRIFMRLQAIRQAIPTLYAYRTIHKYACSTIKQTIFFQYNIYSMWRSMYTSGLALHGFQAIF